MDKNQFKDQLKESLIKRELVKPSLTEERLAMEVESLCDVFCQGSVNFARGSGAVPAQDSDILF